LISTEFSTDSFALASLFSQGNTVFFLGLSVAILLILVGFLGHAFERDPIENFYYSRREILAGSEKVFILSF